MMLLQPRHCVIRRAFENGVWFQYRHSPHQQQIHMKIYRLQVRVASFPSSEPDLYFKLLCTHSFLPFFKIDNQLPNAQFPTVLAPTPLPKSIAAESSKTNHLIRYVIFRQGRTQFYANISVPKPFTELSIMIKRREFSNVLQFKSVFSSSLSYVPHATCTFLRDVCCRYFRVLVQEMSFKLNINFINALIDMAVRDKESEEQVRERFQSDVATVDRQLVEFAAQSSSNEQRHFYDNLHISPLKV